MSNDIRSEFITLAEPTSTNKIVEYEGGNGSDIIQLQSYLTEGSNTGLVQRAWGGEAADIFNVNFERPGDGTVGIDFNTGNLKAMAEMLVEPDWDVREKRIAIDTAQAVLGFGIDVTAAAAGAIPIIGDGGAGVIGAGLNLALDLATIGGHAALDIEEYNNNLAGIDEFFDDPERQDWGSVNVQDTRTVVEIRDFQVGVDTITLPSLPKGWTWQPNIGKFGNGKRFVSLSFKNGSNNSGEILRIGFKDDRIASLITEDADELINDLLVKSNSGWAIGKTINREKSTLFSSLNGTVAGDFLSVDEKNNNRIVTLSGGLGDDILIGRLNGNDSLDGGEGNDYIQPGDGDDTIHGGEGYDRVDYSNLKKRVKITAANFNNNFKSIEGIIATESDDKIDLSRLTLDERGIKDKDVVGLFSLEGRGGNDTLQGSSYDDFIDGGVGIDSMIGGEGNDVYVVDESSDVVIERADRGTDKIESSGGFSLASLPHVENLTIKGFTTTPRVMFGTGNAANNVIKMNDTFSPESISATLFGNAGYDTISGGTDSDLLYGGADGDYLYGEIGNDSLYGETGVDFLDGGAGNDSLDGGADIDYLYGEIGVDFLDGGAGDDSLYGGADDDSLYGETGVDFLDGGTGNDFLYGGAGNDTLNGGVSAETYSDYFGEVIKTTTFPINSTLENAIFDINKAIKAATSAINSIFLGNINITFNRNLRQVADVNGDGRADIVGFKLDAVYTALGQADGTFGESIEAKDDDFTVNDGILDNNVGSFDRYPRQVADVNGDGRADIVGFGNDAVRVALGLADGTFAATFVAKDDDFTVNDQNYGEGWKSFDKNPRQLGDVNGDGRADIIGFANESVGVSLGQADGTFGSVILAKDDDFTSVKGGYESFDKNPRHVADVNGDGRADIVAFSNDAVYTALGQAEGTFGDTIEARNDDFTVNDANYGIGWSSFDEYPRQLGDVNGDGRADIVGFARDSVGFALGQADGTFDSVILAKEDDFTFNDGNNNGGAKGWKSFYKNPRQVADVNGDGRADIIGFADLSVQVSLAIDLQDDVLTGGEGADTFVFDSFDSSDRSFDVITDFSHAEGDKIQIGSEFGTTSSDRFSYDSGDGELSFDSNHFATLNTDSGFNVSEDLVF